MIPEAAVDAAVRKRAERDAHEAAVAKAYKDQARRDSRVNPKRK